MFTWLVKDEASTKNIILLGICLIAINVVWCSSYLYIFGDLFPKDNEQTKIVNNSVNLFSKGYVIGFLKCYSFLLLMANSEEMLFRLIPLGVAFLVSKKISPSDRTQFFILVSILSSWLFGYMHGGYQNILLQGVGGFLYCIQFMKSGLMRGELLQATCATTVTHFSWNAGIITIVALFVQT
jgi:membrane protease YdiL (CAAX protease family)